MVAATLLCEVRVVPHILQKRRQKERYLGCLCGKGGGEIEAAVEVTAQLGHYGISDI